MAIIRFDKLIDNYLPTHEGDFFHPDQSQELTASLGDDGLLHIAEAVDLEDYGIPFKQIGFTSESDDGVSNPKVYYLNVVADEEDNDPLTIVADLQASNARALRVTANHALVFRTSYPYNPQTLKKLTVRLKAISNGDIRVGLVGISDKAYVKPDGTSGFPVYSSDDTDFYEVAVTTSNSPITTDGYVTITGYFKGLSATASTNTYPADDVDYPVPLYDDVAHEHTTTDVAMAIKCRSGEYWIDSIELFDVENSIADIPGGSDVLQTLVTITDDGYLTPTEKRWLSPQFTGIIEEHTTIKAQAISFGVVTTSFDDIYDALYNEIITNLTYLASGDYFTTLDEVAVFKNGTTGGLTYPQAFRKLWADYWEAKAIIEMEIVAIPGEAVEGVLEYITTDYNLTPAEKRWLKVQYDALLVEYTSIVAQATTYAVDYGAYATEYNSLYNELNAPQHLESGVYLSAFDTVAVFKTGTIGGLTHPQLFRKHWADYATQKEAILKLIADAPGELVRGISLVSDTGIILISPRGELTTTQIVFTSSLTHIPYSALTWVRSDGGDLEEYEIDPGVFDPMSRVLDTSTVIDDAVAVSVSVTYSGTVYSASITVRKISEGVPSPQPFGAVTSIPTVTPDNEPLMIGDHFTWDAATSGIFLWGHSYVYIGKDALGVDIWEETVDFTHLSNLAEANIEIGRREGAITYSRAIFTDYLFATKIEVLDELVANYHVYTVDQVGTTVNGHLVTAEDVGTIYSGARIGADGRIEGVFAEFWETVIHGLIKSDALDTQDEETSAAPISATSADVELWNENALYNLFPVSKSQSLQSAVFTWDGEDYTKATKLSGQKIIYDQIGSTVVGAWGSGGTTQIGADYTVPSGMPSNTFEVEVDWGWNTFIILINSYLEVWRSGALLYTRNRSTNTQPKITLAGLEAGDVIKCFVEWGIGYVELELRSIIVRTVSTFSGLIGLRDDNYIYTLSIAQDVNKWHDWNWTGAGIDTDSIITKASGSAIVTACAAIGADFIQCAGTLYLDGETYALERLRRAGDAVYFYSSTSVIIINAFVDGTNIGVYAVDLEITSITLYAQLPAVMVKYLIPKAHDTYDLGQAGVVVPGGTENRYFRNLYLSGDANCARIDTGNGPTEVYDMNQDLKTTDSPTFVNISGTSIAVTGSEGSRLAGSYLVWNCPVRPTISTSNSKHFEIKIKKAGTYTTSMTLSNSNGTTYGRVYKNGSAVGTARSVDEATTTYTQDLDFAAGDLVQLYAYDSGTSGQVSFRLYCGEEGALLNYGG